MERNGSGTSQDVPTLERATHTCLEDRKIFWQTVKLFFFSFCLWQKKGESFSSYIAYFRSLSLDEECIVSFPFPFTPARCFKKYLGCLRYWSEDWQAEYPLNFSLFSGLLFTSKMLRWAWRYETRRKDAVILATRVKWESWVIRTLGFQGCNIAIIEVAWQPKLQFRNIKRKSHFSIFWVKSFLRCIKPTLTVHRKWS